MLGATAAAVPLPLGLCTAARSSSRFSLHPTPSCRFLSYTDCVLAADHALRKQETVSWSNVCPAFSVRRVHGSSTICRAESDDLLPKLERDGKLIEQLLPDFAELEKGALSSFLDVDLESSFNFDTARHYEIMFLVPEDRISDVQDVIKKVKDFIEENKGRVWRLNDWGMRKLAYKIKKASRANYILMNIEIGSQAINQLNSLFERDERVIRHMVITQKQAVTEDSVPPPEYSPYGSEVGGGDSDDSENEEELEETEEEEEVTLKR